MTRNKHFGNALIIKMECVVLRYGILVATYNGLINLEIKGDSKVVIDCYNEKCSSPSSIMLHMENI